jgi:hypothetical protein
MATENLFIEQKNVRTASFDVKNRILTVPILDEKISPELYDLFLGHEVGHALYTPVEGLIKAHEEKKNMNVLNILEDSRIERKIKTKYPGIRISFLKGYKELFDKDFFETKHKSVNNLNFLDKVNLYCKGGVHLNIYFTDFERELIREIESTETYDDVVELYQKVLDYCKMEEQQKQNEIKMSRPLEDDEDDDYDDEDEIEYDENGEPETKDDDWEEENNFDDTMEGEESNEQVSIPVGDHHIRSYTDEAYRRNESQLFADKEMNYVYINIPKVDIKQAIFDYKDLFARYKSESRPVLREEFNKYRRESNKVVSYLVKEFELRKNAEQMKRASVSKTGDLNMDKIFSYQFSEDIFKKMTVVPGGKSHGLIMFLDWSGSMANHIENTVKQLFNLVLFCKKVNIPFEVYAFTDATDFSKPYFQKAKPGDAYMGSFILMNILSSRMSASEFTDAGGALMYMTSHVHHQPHWFRLSGTPLNEAVITAMELVPYFQKKYKLQIVNTVFLTDGDGAAIQNYYRQDGGIQSFGYRRGQEHVVFVDPVNKQQVIYKSHESYFKMTGLLVALLKARTGANVIGFYVATPKELLSKMYDFFGLEWNSSEREKLKDTFRKDKYLVATKTLFDDYYVLRSNALDTNDDAEFIVRENATTRGLVSAFTKYTTAKINNRVILNRFIGLIS